MTVITRRKVDSVAEKYNVDIAAEESSGRLVQHVESRFCPRDYIVYGSAYILHLFQVDTYIVC